MMKHAHLQIVTICALVVAAAGGGLSAQKGKDRFEVSSIKGIRPTLVNTINALKKGDVKAARAGFDAYDSGWNGIEVYINTRDKAMYDALEHEYQARIAKALAEAAPNVPAILADAQAMLTKFDEAVANV